MHKEYVFINFNTLEVMIRIKHTPSNFKKVGSIPCGLNTIGTLKSRNNFRILIFGTFIFERKIEKLILINFKMLKR